MMKEKQKAFDCVVAVALYNSVVENSVIVMIFILLLKLVCRFRATFSGIGIKVALG